MEVINPSRQPTFRRDRLIDELEELEWRDVGELLSKEENLSVLEEVLEPYCKRFGNKFDVLRPLLNMLHPWKRRAQIATMLHVLAESTDITKERFLAVLREILSNSEKCKRAAHRELAKIPALPKGQFRVLTRMRQLVTIDPSRKACEHFGFYHLERISTAKGPATVLGVGKSSMKEWTSSFLYVMLDIDDGASFWDNGHDHFILVETCKFALQKPKTPIPSNVVINLVRAMQLHQVDFRPMILFDFQVVDASLLKPWHLRKKEIELFLSRVQPEDVILPSAPIFTYRKPVPVKAEFQQPTELVCTCPTCKKSFPETEFHEHFQTCLEMQHSVEIPVLSRYLRFGNFQGGVDSNGASSSFPELKTLAAQAVKKAVDANTPPEDLARLFDYVQSINNRELAYYTTQLLYPNLSKLLRTKSLMKILGKQGSETLLITFISLKKRINLRIAAEILDFSLEHHLEDVKKIISNSVDVFDLFHNSDELGELQSWCLRELQSIKLTDLMVMPKFQQLPKEIQNIVSNLSAQYNPQEKVEEDYSLLDDLDYYSAMDTSDNEPEEEEE